MKRIFRMRLFDVRNILKNTSTAGIKLRIKLNYKLFYTI